MKIKVDNKDLFELSEVEKKVICNDINDDIFQADMERRLQWVLKHKYEQCFKRLKAEWEPKLAANGVRSLPVDKTEFAELVFSQPNYKNRKERDKKIEQEEAVSPAK